MSNEELRSKVQELRELRRMAAELNIEIEAIQDAIKAHMTSLGVDNIQGGDYVITWKEVKTSRFDKAAMVNTFGAECYNKFCKTSVSRRFVLA